MRRAPSFWESRGRRFLLRLVLAYLIVPATAPVLLSLLMMGLSLLMMGRTRLMAFSDWAGIVLLYATFCFAAMVVLGIPLLILYARLHWSGFFAFVAGGALSAAATYALVVRGHMKPDQLVIFTLYGVVEGLALRLILFGVALRPPPVATVSR